MRPILSWLKTRLGTFSLLPEYGKATAKQWMNILFGETVVGAIFLVWWALANPKNPPLIAAFVVAVIVAGYFVWRADHVRLEKKIEVTQARKHTWDREGREGIQYYFGIVNKSEALTINRVRAQLMQMIPEIASISWLPITLHQQHDNLAAQTFDLHPSEPKNIDLLTGINGEKYFNVSHIVLGPRAVVTITGRHRLKIMITGADIPILFVWFVVWMDEDGVLRCEME
jgi:hypothetical protein